MPTILYAEDDADRRAMMRLALQNTNFSLIEAVDGEDALIKIFSLKPDLILLDLFMPNLDGYGVMDAVKSNPATRRIPIVVLSSWPTGDNRKRILQAGAAEFVPKSFAPVKLVQILQSLLTPNLKLIPPKVKSDTAPLMA